MPCGVGATQERVRTISSAHCCVNVEEQGTDRIKELYYEKGAFLIEWFSVTV